MPTYPVISIENNKPTFKVPILDVINKVPMGGAVRVFSPAEYITEQQRAWFKGVLLPALSKDTGDSVQYWETKLKLAVLPDDFQPFYVVIGKQIFPVVPSITKLGMRKMNRLIEGSVAHLRDEKIYGDHFLYVTLPDKELRSKK